MNTGEPPAAVAVPLRYEDEVLARLALPARQLEVLRGIGSGLTRRAEDPAGTFWAVGDRGPNLKVKLAVDRYGLSHLTEHGARDGAKVMPRPDLGPAMSQLRLEGDEVRLIRTVPLRDENGQTLTGLPMPGSGASVLEPALALDGSVLAADPAGADTEGIAPGPEGTFFIGDEYGPSLLHVSAEGQVLARWVPAGLEHQFAGACYPVLGVLPAIAGRRRLNRGFEALAASEDGSCLFLAFQSPLAHPDEDAHRRAAHVRLWLLDTQARSVTAQFVYPLDEPSSFRRDAARGEVDRSDIKVSELAPTRDGGLLVLERASQTTKLYKVRLDPSAAIPAKHLDVATVPTLEQLSMSGELGQHVPVLEKSLTLSTDDHGEIDADLEGMILLSERSILLVNDNDFGTEGARTRFWRVDLP